MRVNMHEAKTNLSRLVAAVESGEEEEVEIARAGQVVARIVAPRPRSPRRPGYWAGRVAVHADPFDRMLIAQAQLEGFTLVSVDSRFADYDVELLPLG